MPDLIDTLLAVVALAGTAWLASGLCLDYVFQRHPARGHGILVATSIGTLLTPVLFVAVKEFNGGILPGTKTAAIAEVTDGSGSPRSQPAVSHEVIQGSPLNQSQITPKGTSVAYSRSTTPDDESAIDLTHAASPTDQKSPGAAWVGHLPWKKWLLIIWIIFSLLLLLRLLRDFVAGCWLVRQSRAIFNSLANEELDTLAKKLAMGLSARLALSKKIPSPVLWAWSNPARILLPDGIQGQGTIKAILLHELAHLARHDHLSALAADLVLCLLPWHPLAWWVRRSMAARAEEACDDWVVANGCDPVEYAQTLVSLAPATAGALGLAAVSKRSPLRERIQRLLNGRSAMPFLGRMWVAGLFLSSLFLASALALAQPRMVQGHSEETVEATASGAQAESLKSVVENQKPFEIDVLVLQNGGPVEKASVWILEGDPQSEKNQSTKMLGPLTTPKSGLVRFPLNPAARHYEVFARNESGQIGLGSCGLREEGGLPGESLITLSLQNRNEIKGRLFLDGKPLAGAECKIKVAWSIVSLKSTTLDPRLEISLPPAILGVSGTVKSDQAGHFSIQGIPERCSIIAKVAKDGLGRGQLVMIPGKPIEAELEFPGNLSISIAGEPKPIAIQEIELSARADDADSPPQKRRAIRMIPPTPDPGPIITVPGTGSYSRGNYRLSIPLDPALPYYFGPSQIVKIESGKTTNVTVRKIPLAVCSGRIVDAKTGRGAANLRFHLKGTERWREALPENKDQDFTEEYEGKTDADGRYSIACRGNHTYTPIFGGTWYNETDYEMPRPEDAQKRVPAVPRIFAADGAKINFPDIALTPSRVITGIVRDDTGKVVDGPYEVYCPTRSHTRQDQLAIENGKFTLSQLKPNIPLKIFIRKGKAVNIPSIFPIDKLDDPLQFRISEKNQVSCIGRVVDSRGKPISRAEVTVYWRAEHQGELTKEGNPSPIWGKKIASLETDDQGKFVSDGLWPLEWYQVHVIPIDGLSIVPHMNHPGFTALRRSVEGERTIDFGDITLKDVGSKE